MPASDLPRIQAEEGESRESTLTCALKTPARRVLAFWPNGSSTFDATLHKKVVIGRALESDLRVDDASVSRMHAIIYFQPTLAVEDCGSTNGTMIGAVRVPSKQRIEIASDNVISVGNAMIVIQGVGGDEREWDDETERHELVSHAVETGDSLRRTTNAETKMARFDKLVDLVAKSVLSVLLVGETGVGKEVAAERIHNTSGRSGGPLVKLNCAALPEQLLESELFGYERGAFTGADTAKPGLVEASHHGTLFLDEVGEIPLATQAKLLRVLEAREVLRLGALKPRAVDLRVVAATNRDLEALVREGKFRSDLYFRLNGITLEIPPLRERMEELPGYARKFMLDACKRLGCPPASVSDSTMALLMGHSWPGNLRELRNVIERAVVLASGGPIERAHVVLNSREVGGPPPADESGPRSIRPSSSMMVTAPPMSLPTEDGDERERIMDALSRSGGNQTQAAKLLGMARRTLVYKLGLFGIPRPRKKV